VAAYDAGRVLDLALVGATSGADVVAALRRLGTIDSPRGAWHFSPTHNPVQSYYLREVRSSDGRLVNAIIGSLTAAPAEG
jgi:branched-chain amino acid transport system substrate-binding protein